jgi:thiol-disulfide isomerase/thioredoxin
MTASLVAVLCVIAAALGVAVVVGVLVNRRSGTVRESFDPLVGDTADLGLQGTGPTVVHFSAVWCGPCAAVRRVVNEVCTCGAPAFGAIAADDVHLRRRRPAAVSRRRCAEGR